MPMVPFVERFPELGSRETRIITVPPGECLPPGEYAFVEMYCSEPGCDCRRVTISVFRPDTGWNRVWATISYGWESLDYYRKWGGDWNDPTEMKGAELDPLNEQSPYADALLDVFRHVIHSPGYVERIQRHYRMFRQAIDAKSGLETNRLENRRNRLRDPRRRGKKRR